MAITRFKGETAGERLDYTSISDADMIQLRHKPGTIDDADKGISKASLQSCPFGVSDTAAATAAKAASLTDSNPDFTLVSGREVVVCFTTANTASNPTLNFAGSGAIPIYYTNGTAVGAWAANTWMHLKYFYATVGNTTIQRWILLSPLPVNEVTANNMNSVTSGAVYDCLDKVRFFYKNYGQQSISAGITLFDIPTEIANRNIVAVFGIIGSYIIPRPHYNNAGSFSQNWGLGFALTGGKLNLITSDSWSGILQVVFIYSI